MGRGQGSKIGVRQSGVGSSGLSLCEPAGVIRGVTSGYGLGVGSKGDGGGAARQSRVRQE